MDRINELYEIKKLMLTRYPRFASEIAAANLEFRTDLQYKTAATDGKDIFFDPDYFASLSIDDRLFLIAHELMHIKFAHVFRLIDKNGNKRILDVWNEATDAIINANLERDGFIVKDGYVNRKEAFNYFSEEFYEILLKEHENQNDNSKQDSKSASNGFKDDHSLWEEAFEKGQDNEEKNQVPSKEEKEKFFDEKKEFAANREERKIKAQENFARMREQIWKDPPKNETSEAVNLGDIGESVDKIDWRLLLRREIEKSETIWSSRRSIAENNYAYRLEEIDLEDEAETEVLIDVSGSVDLDLVRSFLRVLKPLLKHSKLKVGCFNEKYWGMVEVKSNYDIDNFVIPKGARGSAAWTEDWDLAVRSFTKKREINKIVFTDGEPCPGTMPKEDLKGENILWLVYGNENFNPCCGKVINITKQQLEKLHSFPEIKGKFR